MVFSSAIFLFIFLPVTFLAYHAVPGLKAKNGLLVDDLEAEKQKILAMTDADWSKADITRWFENAAIVGDSIIRQVRLFHFLDAPVFAEGGIHLSVELSLLDEIEAAKPSVIFL